jgi:hypothetical protein
MLTAREANEMELEAEAFIEEVFLEWAEGHFGPRIGRLIGAEGGLPALVRAGSAAPTPAGAGQSGTVPPPAGLPGI